MKIKPTEAFLLLRDDEDLLHLTSHVRVTEEIWLEKLYGATEVVNWLKNVI